MHELSVCQALIEQIQAVADAHGATAVERILLQIGPLSGVEIPLLERAYPLAAAGTVADGAVLVIEPMPIKVLCQTCGHESEVSPNRLLCNACGDFRTRLISGDEMVLASIELITENHSG